MLVRARNLEVHTPLSYSIHELKPVFTFATCHLFVRQLYKSFEDCFLKPVPMPMPTSRFSKPFLPIYDDSFSSCK